MLERQCVEAVLRAECVFIRLSDGITPTPQIPQSKPSPRRRRLSMYMAWCAVKASDPEMHYAGGDFAPVVVRHFECSIEVEQGLRVEFHESSSLLRRR
ncbi:hypothetical protein GCM10020255_090110 [Rhodococcus baikonurensis]